MTKLREKCEKRDRCGNTGHYREAGVVRRCPCLELELVERKLGTMFCTDPIKDTKLRQKMEQNTVLQGPINSLRPHVAGALLSMKADERFVIMDAYRFIEIFLQKDEEEETSRFAVEADLLVILLGFGDPRNRYLPELLIQALNRRELNRLPTWVILGMDLNYVAAKYSAELHTMISRFGKVTVT